VIVSATALCMSAYMIGLPSPEYVCEHTTTVKELSEDYDIQPEIIMSLVYHESRWNPKAKSRAGACGLTQVIPKWVKEPGVSCQQLMKDPELSLRVGVRILNNVLRSKRYANNNMKVALCMYNAGPRNCRFPGAKKRGSFYSRKVLKTAGNLRKKMVEYYEDHGPDDE
jgi:soluble lytic murein transglycosylase-like protein